MVLQEVLAIAAEGAGTSIRELKESPTFRQSLSRISAQHVSLDPLKLSLQLSLSSLSDFCEGVCGISHRSLDTEVLALLSALGSRLIQSAADCLPDSFDYPKGYEAVPVNLQLPLSKPL